MKGGGKFRGKRRGGKFRGKRRGGRFRGKRRGGRFRGKRRGGSQRGGRVAKFRNVVQELKRLKPPQRIKAMKVANNKFIRHFCSEVRKLKYRPLSSALQGRMTQNSKKIRKLINAKTSMQAKRRMLTQRGGFLPLLLSALAPVLAPLAGKVVRSILQ